MNVSEIFLKNRIIKQTLLGKLNKLKLNFKNYFYVRKLRSKFFSPDYYKKIFILGAKKFI